MAVLDRGRNVIVLRIAYDGSANSGKTTTVRALAQGLGRSSETPEEAGSRTLYFDWLEYIGGLFEGYQLCCQVVSVPGQAMLAHRREYLLSTADAIVHVSAVTPSSVAELVLALRGLCGQRPGSNRDPVGVVVQANKRDHPDALAIGAIRDALRQVSPTIAVVESTAISGVGVRETFVFAVRLALDRVREQIRRGSLEEGVPEVGSAHELLSRMRALEPNWTPTVLQAGSLGGDLGGLLENAQEGRGTPTAGSGSPEGVRRTAVADRERVPKPPDAGVASGLIWPPIEGRVCLAEATEEPPHVSLAHGIWRASTDRGWRFHSAHSEVFDDADEGRTALIQMARLHTTHAALLSAPRCVILAPDGLGRLRLWQIAKERVSLRERLAACLDGRDNVRVAAIFLDTVVRLLELDGRLSAMGQTALVTTLDTAGIFAGATQFIGTFSVAELRQRSPHVDSPSLDLDRELLPVLRDLAPRRGELPNEIKRAADAAFDPSSQVLSHLSQLLNSKQLLS